MQPFCAIVLAGSRGGEHPVAAAAQVPLAVLAPVAGTPILARVLSALAESHEIAAGAIVGSADVLQTVVPIARIAREERYQWLAGAAGPSASALTALSTLQRYPALLVTGDHALLNSNSVDEFCGAARQCDADVVVAFVRYENVIKRLPSTRRTRLRFADGELCGCNLYALLSPAALGAVRLWQHVEAQRKRPWRLISMLGTSALLRYLLGRLTIEQALARLSQLAQCRIRAVYLSDATMAVDVDSVNDWRLAESILATRPA